MATFGRYEADQLISLVQANPILYDLSHPFYKDNNKKNRIWESIALNFYPDLESMDDKDRKAAVKVVKGKWRHMRDNYRRELNTRSQESRSGAGASTRREYVYFRCLDFLRHCSEMRPSESNLDKDNTSAEEGESQVDPFQPQELEGSPAMDLNFPFDDEETQHTVGTESGSQTRAVDTRPNLPAPGPSPVNPQIRRRRGRDQVNVLHEMGLNIQQVLQGLHHQNKQMHSKHSAFGIAIAEELGKVHDDLTAELKAKMIKMIAEAQLVTRQMNACVNPPMPPQMAPEEAVHPSLIPHPPPMATTGRGTPPVPSTITVPQTMACTSRGPPPMTSTSRGPPPMASTSRGPPPMASTSRGPPPMASTSRGPPPMASTSRGPPPMASTSRGPPPVASTWRGPPPVASTWRGPPPSASWSRGPPQHTTQPEVWGQYEGWGSPAPHQSQFLTPTQTFDDPQSQSAASTASETEQWQYGDDHPNYTNL